MRDIEAPVRDSNGESSPKLWSTALDLRRRIGATAASIAETEDWVADTLDWLASGRPQDAERLHARAARARLFAAQERDLAAVYGYRCPDSTPAGGKDTR